MSVCKKETIQRKVIKIWTWNVKTMARGGKINNAILEINIMVISEMRWPDAGCVDKDEHRAFYSSSSDGKLEHGVRVITMRNM